MSQPTVTKIITEIINDGTKTIVKQKIVTSPDEISKPPMMIPGMTGGMFQRPQQRPPRPVREAVNGRFTRVQPRAGSDGFLGAGEKVYMNRDKTLRRPSTVDERIADIERIVNENGEIAVKDLNDQDRAMLTRGLKNGICEVRNETGDIPKIVTKSESEMIDDMFG